LQAKFKDANLILKASSLRYCTPKQLNLIRVDDTNRTGIEYLGVQYAVEHSPSCAQQLRWRHDPDRIQKWTMYLGKIGPDATARDVAQVCGALVWNKQVKLEPLCLSPPLIDTLRITAKAVGGDRNKWDDAVPQLEEKHWDYLRTELSRAMLNPWIAFQGAKTTRTQTIFTDASKSRMGCVLYDVNGDIQINNVWSNNFPLGIREAHIFIRELSASVWFVICAIRRFGWTDTLIYLGVDNSACFFALQNMYSANVIACEWLSRLHHALRKSGCSIEPILVISEDNPADPPSRGLVTVDHNRRINGWKAVQEHQQGRRFSSVPHHANDEEGIRQLIDGFAPLDINDEVEKHPFVFSEEDAEKLDSLI
jgi:hypothetical protein